MRRRAGEMGDAGRRRRGSGSRRSARRRCEGSASRARRARAARSAGRHSGGCHRRCPVLRGRVAARAIAPVERRERVDDHLGIAGGAGGQQHPFGGNGCRPEQRAGSSGRRQGARRSAGRVRRRGVAVDRRARRPRRRESPAPSCCGSRSGGQRTMRRAQPSSSISAAPSSIDRRPSGRRSGLAARPVLRRDSTRSPRYRRAGARRSPSRCAAGAAAVREKSGERQRLRRRHVRRRRSARRPCWEIAPRPQR